MNNHDMTPDDWVKAHTLCGPVDSAQRVLEFVATFDGEDVADALPFGPALLVADLKRVAFDVLNSRGLAYPAPFEQEDE